MITSAMLVNTRAIHLFFAHADHPSLCSRLLGGSWGSASQQESQGEREGHFTCFLSFKDDSPELFGVPSLKTVASHSILSRFIVHCSRVSWYLSLP